MNIEEENPLVSIPEQAVAQPYSNDEEDISINTDIQKVFDMALEAYENQISLVEIIEPRYAARTAEVAANYLNTSLNAVSLKARVKNDKRKVTQFIPFGNNITNSNVVVADRNSILKMLGEREKNEL